MHALIFAVCLFVAAFAVHCALWRLLYSLSAKQALLGESLLLLVVFIACFALAVLPAFVGAIPGLYPQSVWEWLHVSIFYWATSMTYIGLFFPLIQGGSPSLTVVKFVHAAGNAGRSLDEVHGLLGANVFLNQRMRQMVSDGLLIEEAGRYRVTAKAKRIGSLFHLAARVLNLPEGG